MSTHKKPAVDSAPTSNDDPGREKAYAFLFELLRLIEESQPSEGLSEMGLIALGRGKLDDMAGVDPLRALVLGFQSSFVAEGGELADSRAALRLGVRLGKQAAAATAWQGRVGASLDTVEVTQLLGITRQALDSRKRTGSVLALAGAGTTYYPTWQFDMDGATVKIRPVTLRIVTAFRESVEDISPHTIAAWAMSPQPELERQTPAEWISEVGDDEPVVLAARRTALVEAL